MQLLRALTSTLALVLLVLTSATANSSPVAVSTTPIVSKPVGIRQLARNVFRRAAQPRRAATAYFETPITLTGSVVGADGQPLAGATIWLEGGEACARTNEKGDFALLLPTSGPVSLICTAQGCRQQGMQLSTGHQPNDIYFVLRPTDNQ
ncbi:carboxypeptidase-like regulatory domain-containing protein [Hymenobacter sp. BT18]|uniref:carboxypeptidase regulatory-like domain-containing protein n=1 Tax=Hymenobacter sp. BT18 TaxID=2835648 RepID=UPI00143E41F8|nr:carboxypeptidase regulatory-like domain-containing protein [Hymenobacter sp. BT18]QIX62911.1 carboxypeptidase-like regulatory domain-containing protein [Hymenobacter sp. BT18]